MMTSSVCFKLHITGTPKCLLLSEIVRPSKYNYIDYDDTLTYSRALGCVWLKFEIYNQKVE